MPIEPKMYGRCLRCGRKLQKEEYKLIGFGKVCQEKYKTKHSKPLFDLTLQK